MKIGLRGKAAARGARHTSTDRRPSLSLGHGVRGGVTPDGQDPHGHRFRRLPTTVARVLLTLRGLSRAGGMTVNFTDEEANSNTKTNRGLRSFLPGRRGS